MTRLGSNPHSELRPGEPGYGLPPAEHTYRMQDGSAVYAPADADVPYGAIYDETELPVIFHRESRSAVPRYETDIGRAEVMAHAADPYMPELLEARGQLATLTEKTTPAGGRLGRLGRVMLRSIATIDPDVPAEYYDSPRRVSQLQHDVNEAERKAALAYDNRPERLVRSDGIIGPFYMEPGQMQSVHLEPDPEGSGYHATSVTTRPNPHMGDGERS